MMKIVDTLVVGGGLVGMSTASELLNRGGTGSVAVVEKESGVAMHQSGRSSGVIHAGMYYAPGSLRAKLCVEGLRRMYRFVDERGIRHRRVGKLIVALNEGDERRRLEEIARRGELNGVEGLEMIGGSELRRLEPNVGGVGALYSPNTGIVDFAGVCQSLADDVASDDRGHVLLDFDVVSIERERRSEADGGNVIVASAADGRCVVARRLVTAAGLHEDRVARMAGASVEPQMIPFRGSFMRIVGERKSMVERLIYPVPDPQFPFLGVHVTPTVDGDVLLGPNAVLGFAREGYSWSDVNARDLVDMASSRGLRRLAMRHIAKGVGELHRDIWRPAFVRAMNGLMPSLRVQDTEYARSGVRALAVADGGSIIDDFVFDRQPDALHVRNAPSPAATSCFPIASFIVDQLVKI
jgi:L-2-hydroxyglutarate oxidase LhgO